MLILGNDDESNLSEFFDFKGIFGHKTTYEFVPVDGMFPEVPEAFKDLLCYGPMCRYACDLPLMLKAMLGAAADPLELDKQVNFEKLTIYYMLDDGGNPLTSFVDKRIQETILKVSFDFCCQ